ncbi:hypothetical protein Tco_1492285 [Tanacetum coccineum]
MMRKQENEEEENDSLENIHVNPSTPLDPSVVFITEKVLKFNSFFESLGLVPQSSDTEVVCIKGDDGEVMFIELIRKNDDSSEGEPEEEGSTDISEITRKQSKTSKHGHDETKEDCEQKPESKARKSSISQIASNIGHKCSTKPKS